MLTTNTLLQNRYLIRRQLGRGGMGAVYEAFDQNVSCAVAIKETLVDSDELRRAFEREAQLLANLSHHALPRVTDHFFEHGSQFLVMEYVTGQDLAQRLSLRGGPFSAGEVLPWADTLLDALEYLHSANPPIIHRDIKPSNVKLSDNGRIYLLDFGLSKGTAGLMQASEGGRSVVGFTRNYAPLEQMSRGGTDPRSDLYSLGATLYHLLTAVYPHDALTRMEEMRRGRPDPLIANPNSQTLPPAVGSVLFRAMALGREERPSSAAEMRRMLRAAVSAPHDLSAASTLRMPAAASHYSTRAMATEPVMSNAYGGPSVVTRADAGMDTAETQAAAPARRRRWPLYVAGAMGLLLVGTIAGMALLYYMVGDSLKGSTNASPGEVTPSMTAKPPGQPAQPSPAAAQAAPESGSPAETARKPPALEVQSPPPASGQVVQDPRGAQGAGAPASDAGVEVEYEGFKFKLQECRMSPLREVTCDLTVTNAGDDRTLTLFSGDSSMMYDDAGNAYRAAETQIANHSSRDTWGRAEMLIISKVPTRATLKFAGVSSQATRITRLTTNWSAGERFDVPIRNITIRRQ